MWSKQRFQTIFVLGIPSHKIFPHEITDHLKQSEATFLNSSQNAWLQTNRFCFNYSVWKHLFNKCKKPKHMLIVSRFSYLIQNLSKFSLVLPYTQTHKIEAWELSRVFLSVSCTIFSRWDNVWNTLLPYS